MLTLIILFFVSLTAIVVMLGRKLAHVNSGEAVAQEHPHVFVPDFQKIKQLTKVNSKRYGYLLLVATLRAYVRSINMLKIQYRNLETKIKNMRRGSSETVSEEQQASKFLKMISEYKHKIRKIKHKIHEEEKIM